MLKQTSLSRTDADHAFEPTVEKLKQTWFSRTDLDYAFVPLCQNLGK